LWWSDRASAHASWLSKKGSFSSQLRQVHGSGIIGGYLTGKVDGGSRPISDNKMEIDMEELQQS
jgi:hypothetical protein